MNSLLKEVEKNTQNFLQVLAARITSVVNKTELSSTAAEIPALGKLVFWPNLLLSSTLCPQSHLKFELIYLSWITES